LIHKGPGSGILEDFIVQRYGQSFCAYYTSGKEWWTQQVYMAVADNPKGPFSHEKLLETGNHCRIEKAVAGPDEWYATAVYRRLPCTGIWHHQNMTYGTLRRLIIPPKPGSLYSVSACNPCLFKNSLFFEGRTKIMPVVWRIFQADTFGNVDEEPICDGGNPYVTQFGDTLYLYFSKLRPRRGFDTWVMTQPA